MSIRPWLSRVLSKSRYSVGLALRRNYFFYAIILLAVMVLIGVADFHSIIVYYRMTTQEFLRRQAQSIGQNIESSISEFEENYKYIITTGRMEKFLFAENADIKTVDAIRRFYSINQNLIGLIEVFDQTAYRSVRRDKNNYFDISPVKKNTLFPTLASSPQISSSVSKTYYTLPLRNEEGKVVANIRLTLEVADFLKNQLAAYYVGQDSWVWSMDDRGQVFAALYSGKKPQVLDRTYVAQETRIRKDLSQQFEGVIEHSLFSGPGGRVLSAYYPIKLFDKSLGIILSVNQDALFGAIKIRVAIMAACFIAIISFLSVFFGIVIFRQKSAEQKLRESDERWQFALEGSGDGVWDWDLRTNQVFFSKRWKAMLGYEEHEIKNELNEWKRLLHPEDLPGALREIEKYRNREIPIYVNEQRMLAKDGKYHYILDRGIIIRSGKDQIPTRMVGTHTDITKLKETEQKLRQLSHAVEQSASTVFITNTQGVIEYVNPKFMEITGYTRDEVIGRKARILSEGKLPQEIQQQIWSDISSGKEWRGEFENKKKNGDRYWESVVISSIRNAQGEITQYLIMMEDITRRKEAEANLAEEQKNLKVFFEAAVDQEMDAIVLKQEVNELLKNSGQPIRYREVEKIEQILDIERARQRPGPSGSA